MRQMIPGTAVYQDGVLKLDQPLPNLIDGDRVEVVVVRVAPIDRDAPEEVARRERMLKAFDEQTAARGAAEPNDNYDILEALNANQLHEGARPLIPPTEGR